MNILLYGVSGAILAMLTKNTTHHCVHCPTYIRWYDKAHAPATPRYIPCVCFAGRSICARTQIPAAEPIPQIPDAIPHLVAFPGAARNPLYTAEATIQARTGAGIYTAHRAYVCSRGDAFCYAVYPQGECVYRVAAHGIAFAFRVYDDVIFFAIGSVTTITHSAACCEAQNNRTLVRQ